MTYPAGRTVLAGSTRLCQRVTVRFPGGEGPYRCHFSLAGTLWTVDRLPREFFHRAATDVAPDLLGCVLWHDSPAGLVALRLVEVEAYEGLADPASHAFRGRTARNAVMFGPPGHAYVYFTYGMHFCVNLVCQPAGRAEAVLLRAGEITQGTALATLRRGGRVAANGSHLAAGAVDGDRKIRGIDLARGPGRLCQALGIDRSLDGADVCGADSPLGIGPPAVVVDRSEICTGPRVGISQAAEWPWRYWIANDRHVSVFRSSKPRAAEPKPVSGSGAEGGTMHR
jgi:DNA-3-methyladenine glycosylase